MKREDKIQDRRNFLKTTSLLSLSAATGFAMGPDSVSAAQLPVQRTGGPRLKLSLNAYSFNSLLLANLKDNDAGIDLMELLDFCAKHNFDAIDPTGYYFPGYPEVPTDSYINRFKRRAFQLGLDISGTGIRNNFTEPDKTKRAADVVLIKRWIEVAAKLGAPVIRVFAGAEPEGYARQHVLDWMVDDLGQCAEYGKQYGVIVGVQNHGGFLKTADQTLEVVKRVDSDWFGIVVDTGNFWSADPYDDIARVLPYAVNWQIKDRVNGRGDRMNLKRLVQIIQAGGYRGYLPIETLATKDKPYDPMVVVPEFLSEVRGAIELIAINHPHLDED